MTLFFKRNFFLTCLFLLSFTTFAESKKYFPPKPQPIPYIYEHMKEKSFTAPVFIKKINQEFKQYEEKDGIKFVYVVIESTGGQCSIDGYAADLSHQWGIALENNPEDRHVLLVVAAEDAKAKILIGGGIGSLFTPESITFITHKFIVQKAFLDNKRKHDQFQIQQGIRAAAKIILKVTRKEWTAAQVLNPPFTRREVGSWIIYTIAGILIALIIWVVWQTRSVTGDDIDPDIREVALWLKRSKKKKQ